MEQEQINIKAKLKFCDKIINAESQKYYKNNKKQLQTELMFDIILSIKYY